MTKTLQDRIIRIFYKEFGYLETPIDFYTGNTYSNPKMKGIEHLDKIAEFIKTSIKEVEEETKGDVLNKLHAMVCDLATDKGKDLAKEDCLELIRYQIERIYGKKLLSITNKEK